MAEYDLLGYDDCSDDFAEGPVDTDEHIRQTAYHAIATQRGQDDEEPDRWADVWSLLEQGVAALAASALATIGTDLEETDSRVARAIYRLSPGEITRWIADITTRSGTVTAEGALQPLPQDDLPPDEEPLPDPGPVPAGVRTIRQVALTGGLFPHWLLGPNSGRIVYTLGLLLDMQLEWLMLGIQQRFPLVCDEGALPWLGRDLGIRRGLREALDAYRQRLTRWAPTWRRAGNAFAILEQAQIYFSPQAPRVHLVQRDPGADGKPTRSTWCTRETDGSETFHVETTANFDWDSADPARPASLDDLDPRVWLIIEQPPADTTGLFASRSSVSAAIRDPDGMNGCVRPDGSQAPADQYRDLFNLVYDWRAMGTYVAGVLLYLGTLSPSGSGAQYPDGTWFDPLNDTYDGNRIPTTYRVLYLDRFPGDRLPESPEPYPV
jgi:hypothetical protein